MGVRKPKKLKVSASQLKALQGRIKNRALAEEDWDVVMAMTETVECLSKALAENKTSLARLCKYLLGAPTETARNIFGKDTPADPEKKPDKPDRPPRKGHGRKSASTYTGGRKVHIEHPELHSGDHCPPFLSESWARRPSTPRYMNVMWASRSMMSRQLPWWRCSNTDAACPSTVLKSSRIVSVIHSLHPPNGIWSMPRHSP